MTLFQHCGIDEGNARVRAERQNLEHPEAGMTARVIA
jgi:hypothetical protein